MFNFLFPDKENSSNNKKKKPSKKKSTTSKKKSKTQPKETEAKQTPKKEFPKKFPFWARLLISKNRTTLVIDEVDEAYNKKKKRMEPGFVHREAIHPNETRDNVKGYEEINPNPDKTDKKPMFLKPPAKLPKRMFKPHNKNLDMPKHLEERYSKNNKK